MLVCRWPFKYDPVYGLPIVNDVWTYGQVLRGMREGRVLEVLWYVKVPGKADYVLLH